jgi:hypothetical protein
MSKFQILSSVALTICILFYLYVIGSFLEITVYPLINRITSSSVFQENIITNYIDRVVVIAAATSWLSLSISKKSIRYSLSVIYGASGFILAVVSQGSLIFDIHATLSLPLIISVLLYYHKQNLKTNNLNFNANLTLRYISIAVIIISGLNISFQTLSIFIASDFGNFFQYNTSNELFLLISSFSTVYIFILVFCVPVKVVFRELSRILKLNIKEDVVQQTTANNSGQNGPSRVRTRTKISFLLFAMVLSIVLVLIPQHPAINKENQDIGVDTHYYVTWIGELAKSKTLSEFSYQAFIVQGQDGDRPLSLIIMFLVYQIVGGTLSEVIEYFPLALGPGIVLASYFITLELTRNDKISLIAAFFGAVSFHTLAGVYAGFYANWLALIVGYISLVFLFRYLRRGSLSDIIVFSVLLMSVLFFHVYTWTILAAVSGVFLLSLLVLHRKVESNDHSNGYLSDRRIIWLLIFAIIPSVGVDITKVLLTGSSGGLERDIELAQTDLGIGQFTQRWEILNITMHHSFGGVFGNFIILTLGLFWVLKSNMRDVSTVFLIIFLSVGLIPLFIGNWVVQARVLYDIPFEIPAAISLYYLSRWSRSMLVSIAGCGWLVAVSLFTVMNFYLVSAPALR